jgi:hypothetical protein
MNRHLFKLFGRYDTQLGYIKGSSSTVVKFGYWIEENFPVKVYHFKPLYQDQYSTEELAEKARIAWRDFQFINSKEITRRV